jgi:hypothetical protein
LRRTKWLLSTLPALYQFGSAARSQSGIGHVDQFLQLLQITAKFGHTSEDYYRYRMYRDITTARSFLPLGLSMDIRAHLYDKLRLRPLILADKRLFYRACAERCLPVAETIADFEVGSVRWWANPHLPPVNLFSKEAASLCGAGASLWTYLGGQAWRAGDGAVLRESQLIARLCVESVKAPLVLQRQLENHPQLSEMGLSGLCTARIVTMRQPDGDAAEVLLAAFRMPAQHCVADNFAAGGVASPVDLQTGRLGVGVRKSLSVAHVDCVDHPDTGSQIAGRALPCWSDTIELAVKAHSTFAEFPSIGWDIAITPAGPVLVEANYNWDVVLAQQPGCRPLGETVYPNHIFAWLDYAKPASQEPMHSSATVRRRSEM